MNTEINRFNVRVYFLLADDSGKSVLVADEIIRGKPFTKFPGGGLEFGEGTIDCVKREAMEELNQEIEITSHFYTTDFFLESAFKKSDQIISIYYTARISGEQKFKTSDKKFDFIQTVNNEESFRWIKLSDLKVEEFAFAADKKVCEMLIENNGTQNFLKQ